MANSLTGRGNLFHGEARALCAAGKMKRLLFLLFLSLGVYAWYAFETIEDGDNCGPMGYVEDGICVHE